MMTLDAEPQVFFDNSVEQNQAVTNHRTFEKFREWVVGLRYHPRPSVGFGGPVETPFADTIKTPENEARRLPLGG